MGVSAYSPGRAVSWGRSEFSPAQDSQEQGADEPVLRPSPRHLVQCPSGPLHTWPVTSLHVCTREGAICIGDGVNRRPEGMGWRRGARQVGDCPGSGRRYHDGEDESGGVTCEKEESREHGLGGCSAQLPWVIW